MAREEALKTAKSFAGKPRSYKDCVSIVLGWCAPSGVSIDQRTEGLIRGLLHLGARFDLKLALGHVHHGARQILLAAVHRQQAVDLGIGRLALQRASVDGIGDLTGRLVDTVLPGPNSAQTGVNSGIS